MDETAAAILKCHSESGQSADGPKGAALERPLNHRGTPLSTQDCKGSGCPQSRLANA